MQVYSRIEDMNNPWKLPDVEIFYNDGETLVSDENEDPFEIGWYYQYCFPGCLPDSSPFGPFSSSEEALEDLRQNAE